MPRTSLVAVYALLLSVPAAPAADPAADLEARMQKTIEAVSPCVVSVVVSHDKYPRPDDRSKTPGRLGTHPRTEVVVPRRGWGPLIPPPPDKLDLSQPETIPDHPFGSGIVLDAKAGLVLTSHHLIDGATKVYVRGPTGAGSYADIHAADARSDLAVLKLIDPLPGLAGARFADVRLVDAPDGGKANLKKGSWVIAAGHATAAAVGDGGPSASWGILGNVRQRSSTGPQREEQRNAKPLHQYGSLLQTDARVAVATSGSGLFNLDGELVGVGTAAAAVFGSEASGGYAVPMDANYRRIVDVLKAGREVEYGFLGVAPSTPRGGDGVLIEETTPAGPAAEAGLLRGDVLRAVDGHPLRDADDLLLFVGGALAGTDVTVEYERGGRKGTARVALAKISNPLAVVASVPHPDAFGLRVDYTSVRFGLGFRGGPQPPAPPPGVIVRGFEPGSPAEKRFKEGGDAVASWVITRVDDKAVANPRQFFAAVGNKASVRLTLVDPQDHSKTAPVTLP